MKQKIKKGEAMKREVEIRRLIILLYLEEDRKGCLPLINPPTYKEDLKILEKNGLSKNLELTSKGKAILNRLTPNQKKDIKKYFFWNQKPLS